MISGSGEIVAAGTANIVLEGDWTNNATNTGFTASSGSGIVFFNSTNAQSIEGSKVTTFRNIWVKNTSSASLTVNSAITITDELDFEQSGIVHIGTGSITFTEDASTTNATKLKFIDGPVTYIGAKGFTFDIGDGTKWAPIKVYDPGSTAMTVTTQYYYQKSIPNKSSVSAPLVKVSDVEYWHISSPSSESVRVKMWWKNGDESFIKSINSDSLRFAKWDGSNWVDEAATITASSTSEGSITSTAALPLSDLYVTFGSTNNIANPLPIQLLSFTAQCQEQDVVLNWSTASEENNQYFTLLRSNDAEHYEVIAQISGAGNSNEILNYSFVDRYVINGSNYYYTLKQTDYDGKSETFDPVHAKCNQDNEVSLQIRYDNDIVYAVLSNSQIGSIYNMMIIDHTGRVVVQEKQNVNFQNYYRIPSQDLAAGLYSVIYYYNGSISLNEKFFVR